MAASLGPDARNGTDDIKNGKLCRVVGLAGVVVLALIAFTPLPNVVGGRLSTPPRLGRAGAIVVLGGPEAQHGAIHGIVLYRQGLAPVLVFSGSLLEVLPRELLARELGLPKEAVLSERAAMTTRQEATRVGALLRARGIQRILLVTDALSMRRARSVFERAGFDVLPAPSTSPGDSMGPPQDQLGFALLIAEEAAAQLYYRAMGYL
jgi:uncharacterized SAM-binding protein YcdF (DUF218 family)